MLYRIKEVSQRTGVLTHTLRYWEKEFDGLLAPSRSRGRHRFYTDEDVDRVALIRHLLKDEGYSIQGARRALETRVSGDGAPDEAKANGNGHGNGNGNGYANGNGNGHAAMAGLSEQLVDQIAAAVATRVAGMLREPQEPETEKRTESVTSSPGLAGLAEAVIGK